MMEDSLTSVYLTHLLLKLQIAELDYREAFEFAFNSTSALRSCERIGEDLFGSWSTVCRNGKALTIHFRDPEAPPKTVRYVHELRRRHYAIVMLLEGQISREVELDIMSIERIEVPQLLGPVTESEHRYSLACLWNED